MRKMFNNFLIIKNCDNNKTRKDWRRDLFIY